MKIQSYFFHQVVGNLAIEGVIVKRDGRSRVSNSSSSTDSVNIGINFLWQIVLDYNGHVLKQLSQKRKMYTARPRRQSCLTSAGSQPVTRNHGNTVIGSAESKARLT